MPDENPYGPQIRSLIRRYSQYGQTRDLEAARALTLAMAIGEGYSPADVQAMTLLIMSGQPA